MVAQDKASEEPSETGRATHEPVLLQEIVEWLAPKPGGAFIDATLGGGGHSEALLDGSGPDGRLLGLDADGEAIAVARQHLAAYGDRVTLIQANFAEMERVARERGFAAVDGVLFDLGLSSLQLAEGERGFSFQLEGPLDMRFDATRGPTAADLVNELSPTDLADVIWRSGEEPRSRRIARAIVARRPVRSTRELADIVVEALGEGGRLHPATRTFMALRIAVNRELTSLEEALPQAVRLLAPGKGRVAVISYHSLEDRLVKQRFRLEAKDCICPPSLPECGCDHRATLRILTRKPIRPSSQEVRDNPRSRSARLRVAERLPVKGMTPEGNS